MKPVKTPPGREGSLTLNIHIWYIYLHLPHFTIKNNQMKLIMPYMDTMSYGLQSNDSLPFDFQSYPVRCPRNPKTRRHFDVCMDV